MNSTILLFTALIATVTQAAEVPLQSAPRFVDSVVVQSPQFQVTRSTEMQTAGTYPLAEALAPGAFFVFEDNGNATLVRANGQSTTVKCELGGNSFLWKNEVTTRSKSYWDASSEVAVKSLRLLMTYQSDSHLRIDFKNATCTAFEPFDGSSFVSVQSGGKFVYYRDYGYQQSKGSQLVSYDPISQSKTVLADCKDLHAQGVCADFRKYAKGLSFPTIVGVTDRNQVILQSDKQILLLDSTPGAVKLTSLFAVKDGDPTRIFWGTVLAGHKLSFLTIKDEVAGEPDLAMYTPVSISLDSGAMKALAPFTVNGAALDSTGRYLLTWTGLKDVHWQGVLFDTVTRIDLSSGATVQLPAMGAYTYYTNPHTYGGTLSFWTGDLVSYQAANQSATRQWVKFAPDNSIQTWDDRGTLFPSALSSDHTTTLGAKWNSFGATSDLQLGEPFSSGAPTTLVKVPSYRLCEYWFSGNCWNSGDFYYWPETKGIVYYDQVSKSLKTKTISP